MTDWLLPVGVATAALVLTYLFCLRPMRRGQCSAGAVQARAGARRGCGEREAEDLDRALERARADLARLRAEHDAVAPTAAPSSGRSLGPRSGH